MLAIVARRMRRRRRCSQVGDRPDRAAICCASLRRPETDRDRVTALAATVLVAMVVAVAAACRDISRIAGMTSRQPTHPAVDRRPALRQRQREAAVTRTGGGDRRQRNQPADRHRAGHLRVLVGAASHHPAVGRQRPLPLPRVARRARHRRAASHRWRRRGAARGRNGEAVQARGNPDRAALFAAVGRGAAPPSLSRPPSTGSGSCRRSWLRSCSCRPRSSTGGVRTAAPRSDSRAGSATRSRRRRARGRWSRWGFPSAAARPIRASQAEVRSKRSGRGPRGRPHGALDSALLGERQPSRGARPRAPGSDCTRRLRPPSRPPSSRRPTGRRGSMLSRLEAENGDAKGSLVAYRKARALNPSPPCSSNDREPGTGADRRAARGRAAGPACRVSRRARRALLWKRREASARAHRGCG